MLPAKNEKQEKAFSDLFEKYKNLVYKTAFLMFGSKEDADEALQEVFIQVYRFLPGYDPRRGAMTTWLYRITINYCLAHRRKQTISLEPLEDVDILAMQEPVETRVQANIDRRSIRHAIMDLSEKQRVVIILRYYWDLPYKEIAQILSIPLGTVKSRIDLALKTLGTTFQLFSAEPAKDASSIWERVL
ncbi:MAG TPA: RNA polymerase sigma factor [Leptolinea sp.]